MCIENNISSTFAWKLIRDELLYISDANTTEGKIASEHEEDLRH